MTDLLAFLRARLDDDERDVPNWHHLYRCEYAPSDGAEPCSCGIPARVLREVEAKRRILDLHGHDGGGWDGEGKRCNECGGYDVVPGYGWKGYRRLWPCQTLKLLALPHADHPEFRPEWRP